MIVHFINPQKIGQYKYYDVLLVEDDNTLYRLNMGFIFSESENVMEEQVNNILQNLDPTKIITQVIIDTPVSWQF